MDSMSEASRTFSLSKLCFPVWSLAHEPCPSSQMMREEISPSLWSQRLIYPVSGSIRSFTEFSLCFFWKDCTTNLSELGEATSPLPNNKKWDKIVKKQEGKVVICGDFMNIGTKRSENQGREGEVHPIRCRVSNNSWKRQKKLSSMNSV